MNRKTTHRIFMGPSRVLTSTSRLNLRMSLAWRGIRKKSWCPLPNLRKLSMWSHRNRPCIQDEIWPTQENFHWIELCKGIRNISKIYHTISRTEESEAPLVELHKYMARPPGCSFLGASPAHVPVSIHSPMKNLSDIIIDSGSDITLISEKALGGLSDSLKIKKG